MTDLTPPPMSEDDIRQMFLANGFTIKEGLTDLKPYVYEAARDIEAHVNEQWRQRLELRAYESASGMLLGIQNPLPSDTPLYRIKEQG